ncbi:GH32 C-terminal domain-containing protein [Marinicrinis sediminis]|uniref:beta-fructofuranosidase n=1 Tax=Marinicrinis sediminis TaxID=1652465 RepID=A0ABW5RD75_9BACL
MSEKPRALAVAHWSFDESSGRTVLDSISGRHDPVSYIFHEARHKPSTDVERRDGVRGKALLLDGYSTWIEREAGCAPMIAGHCTIEVWIAPRTFGTNNEQGMFPIVEQRDRERNLGYSLGLAQHGEWSFQFGDGSVWQECWSREHRVKPRQWNHLVVTLDPSLGRVSLFLNGELAERFERKPFSFQPAEQVFYIGKSGSGLQVADEQFNLNMVNGLIDELSLYGECLDDGCIHQRFQTVLSECGGQLPVPDLSLNRAVYEGDRHRPVYHLIAPGHWMNEPHGPVYFAGHYHIFYQQNTRGPYWHDIHWGHLVSTDMVHWQDMPFALFPEKDAVDPDGDWSGSACIGPDEVPVLFFTAANETMHPNQMTAVATSTCSEDQDPLLPYWRKHSEPVTIQQDGLTCAEGEVWTGQFRDPFVWKEGNTYYQLVGSGVRKDGAAVGGTALVYSSENLIDWIYQGTLMVGDYPNRPETGQVWELPVLLPLGEDSRGMQKHVFLVNPWYDHVSELNVRYVWYWIGTWKSEQGQFVPDHEQPQLLDVGEHFTGPSGFVDPKGRAVVFSIAQGKRTHQQEHDAGWAHNGGLPVELFLHPDDTLGVRPIDELHSLRSSLVVDLAEVSLQEAREALQAVRGDVMEIRLEVPRAEVEELSLYVRQSPKHEEETRLFYRAEDAHYGIDRTASSLLEQTGKGIQGGVVNLPDETIVMHAYLDKSMIECYLNERKSLTSRVYPTREDAIGMDMHAVFRDRELIVRLQVWQLRSAYEQDQ